MATEGRGGAREASPGGVARAWVAGSACRDFARASHLEWLETNGTGAYAMGTVAGTATRRYHGYLVAKPARAVERRVLLAHVDETAVVGGETVELTTHQYPGAVHPRGFTRAVDFRLDPFPVWRFELPGGFLERSLFLVPGEPIVVLCY